MHATVGQIAELPDPPRSGRPATPWKDAAAEVGFEFRGGTADFALAMLRGEYPWSRQLIAPMEDESYEPPQWKRVYGWDG